MDNGEAGFTEFVRLHGLKLLRFATAITGDPHHAEDVLQVALERSFGRWSKLIAHGDPEWYIRRCIVNAANDGWRRRKRRPEVFGMELGDVGGTYLPFDEVVTRDAVRTALAGLPAGPRTVVVLRYWEGLSEAETAALMDVTVGTVKSQAHRALKALRVRLSLADEPTPAGRS